jgi:hypothetical protein
VRPMLPEEVGPVLIERFRRGGWASFVLVGNALW